MLLCSPDPRAGSAHGKKMYNFEGLLVLCTFSLFWYLTMTFWMGTTRKETGKIKNKGKVMRKMKITWRCPLLPRDIYSFDWEKAFFFSFKLQAWQHRVYCSHCCFCQFSKVGGITTSTGENNTLFHWCTLDLCCEEKKNTKRCGQHLSVKMSKVV